MEPKRIQFPPIYYNSTWSYLISLANLRKSNKSQTHISIEYELPNQSVQRKLGFVTSEIKKNIVFSQVDPIEKWNCSF